MSATMALCYVVYGLDGKAFNDMPLLLRIAIIDLFILTVGQGLSRGSPIQISNFENCKFLRSCIKHQRRFQVSSMLLL